LEKRFWEWGVCLGEGSWTIGMDMVSFFIFRILKNDGGLRKDDGMVESPWTQMKKRVIWFTSM
jgi:hypothetical protein